MVLLGHNELTDSLCLKYGTDISIMIIFIVQKNSNKKILEHHTDVKHESWFTHLQYASRMQQIMYL